MKDPLEDFSFDKDDNDSQKTPTSDNNSKDKLFGIMAYLPLICVFLYFTEDIKKSKELEGAINQGVVLFGIWFLTIILIGIFMLGFFVTKLIGIIYFCSIVYLGFNAYNGTYIKISFLKEISDTFLNKKK